MNPQYIPKSTSRSKIKISQFTFNLGTSQILHVLKKIANHRDKGMFLYKYYVTL